MYQEYIETKIWRYLVTELKLGDQNLKEQKERTDKFLSIHEIF